MNTATVMSSNGTIFIDADTGKVLENNVEDYSDIERFDLEEYEDYWKESKSDTYDILDLAGWNKDGSRFEAEEEFRKSVKEEM